MPPPLTRPPAADTHFHVFDAGVGVAGARYQPGYDAPLASWQVAALAAGVQRGVLVQPSFLGTDNSRLVRELRAWPDSLRGVAVVAPGSQAAELRALDAAGVRGVRLNLAGASHDLSAWSPSAWDTLLPLGWHVELHTDAGALPGVLAQLPASLPVVVDHMGRPDGLAVDNATFTQLAARARRSPVHVKLSGAYRLAGRDAAAIAQRWLAELGPRALLWGSDWPCTNHEALADYPRLHAELAGWVGAEVAQGILRENADQLYWAR